ncbi:M13 family metallopeptidase [Palleronia sp. LCG004]|uniref:M13 family metallopeptidase n=1 Tax=Palleronia sp. LCG004 TaxID=3079304 RepID=UPI0029423FAB|nr:M13 family metallopeptidase [Palleronia sp. LCG004]WOI58295.1 M13 family metallopeptidase [Palleronia sp. LCG004]
MSSRTDTDRPVWRQTMRYRGVIPVACATVMGLAFAAASYAQEAGSSPVGPDRLSFSVENMDRSIDPGQDFYRYAAGGWLNRIERPEKFPRYGIFAITGELVQSQVSSILSVAEAEADTAPDGSPSQLVGKFYRAYMDTDRIDARGIAPIEEDLGRIDAMTGLADLVPFMVRMDRIGGPGVFLGFGHTEGTLDNSQYEFAFASAPFGIDSRFDSILAEPDDGVRLNAYRTYLAETLMVAGFPAGDASRIARNSVEIERALHAGVLLPVERRDPDIVYNPMTLGEVQEQIPEIDLSALLEAAGYPRSVENVVLYSPRYVPVLSEVLRTRSLEEIKEYLKLRLILKFSPVMSTAFQEPTLGLSTVLLGSAVLPPREETAYELVAANLAHPLGQLYVERHLTEDARTTAENMFARVKAAFADRIPTRDWLSEDTRAEAAAKLDTLTATMGRPDEWIDYSGLEIGSDPVGNLMAIAQFEHERYMAKFGGPVVRDAFNNSSTWPTTVNAAYNPGINGFEVPAAILQPPFFEPQKDAAVWFCRMGAILGHEMTHGFDSLGRRYDADGNLRDWWTPTDAANFERKAEKLVEQANSYEVAPGLMANGPLEVGENMADLGGITLAHIALMDYLEEHPEENVEIEGFTPEQRCFLSWAQNWASKSTDAYDRLLVEADPHAPSPYRAIAALQHLPAFYEAFGIKDGDPMWLPVEERITAW